MADNQICLFCEERFAEKWWRGCPICARWLSASHRTLLVLDKAADDMVETPTLTARDKALICYKEMGRVSQMRLGVSVYALMQAHEKRRVERNALPYSRSKLDAPSALELLFCLVQAGLV